MNNDLDRDLNQDIEMFRKDLPSLRRIWRNLDAQTEAEHRLQHDCVTFVIEGLRVNAQKKKQLRTS